MNLSAKLIVYQLKRHFSLKTSRIISAKPSLKYPVLYQQDRSIRNGLLYVIDDPSFIPDSKITDDVLLLLIGKDFSFSFTNMVNVCQIEDKVSAAWVFQVLQEIYQIYNEWMQNLFQVMHSTPTVQKLLEISESVIENPMFVIGMDFTVIGSVKFDFSSLRDDVFGSTDETRYIVNALKNDPNYEKAYDMKGVFYFPGNDYAMPSLCSNIMLNGKTEYRLLVAPGDMPIDDTISFLIEFLVSNISQVLLSSPDEGTNPSRVRYDTFRRLLTNPKADYVEISRSLTAGGWLISHSYLCVLIIPGVQDLKNLTLTSMSSYIENLIPESCTVRHQNSIVTYIDLTLCRFPIDIIMQKIAGFVRDSFLNAGYSRSMMGHFNFYRQYQQAKLTIQIGQQKNPNRWIHHFDDIALPFMLDQMTRKLPSYMICHEELIKMYYQDQNNGTHYYETLRSYLNNNQNATRTAEQLYIHRSTLLYRLEHIQKILKSDLQDPQEILYLMLSYYMIDEDRDKNAQ